MHALPVILTLATIGADISWAGPRTPGSSADSLASRLRRIELTASSPRDAGEAALRLGRLFYARGEYRPAAEAFSRAAARLDPSRKSEALYWAGLSWLGLKSPNPARAALAEVAASGSARGAEALLGIAAAWEQDGRLDKAYDTLLLVLSGDPGEAGATALARLAAVADRLHRPAEAARARARLLASYPSSMEATMAAAAPTEPGSPVPAVGPVTLEAGRFASAGRARALASRARRAGFAEARVLARGDGAGRTFVVMLGSYPDTARASRAQAHAARELGLGARIKGER